MWNKVLKSPETLIYWKCMSPGTDSDFLILQDIFGALQATAVSSGFCLGSCNWMVTSDHEKVNNSYWL